LPTLKQIVAAVNQLAPAELAESWDQVGLQVDRAVSSVHQVMVALDLNSQVIRASDNKQIDGFIVHHPLLFKPLTRIGHTTPQERILIHLIKNDQFVLVAHTNLDKAAQGINQYLAELLGLTQVAVLEPAVDIYPVQNGSRQGLGRVGTLPEAVTLRAFGEFIKTKLPAKWLKVSGDPAKAIQKVALCSGSGGSLVDAALQQQADLYLTGELNYHAHWEAREQGLAVIEAGHGTTEKCFVPLMTAYLNAVFTAPNALTIVDGALPEQEPYRVI
jgi:dinuclear metal center YbgI/SA1388 family protein